jgi:hypothetical protein
LKPSFIWKLIAPPRALRPKAGLLVQISERPIPVDGVAEGFIDADTLHVDGEPLRRALQPRSRGSVGRGEFVALDVVGGDAGNAPRERLDHIRRIGAREVLGGERLHHRWHLVAVNAETGDGRRSDVAFAHPGYILVKQALEAESRRIAAKAVPDGNDDPAARTSVSGHIELTR